jgi:F-type H+-transporting ATPase subunit delta
MLVSKAAKRYATALLETAKEKKAVEDTLKDVLFLKNTLEGARDLYLFLRSPVIKPSDKEAALNKIFSEHVGELMTRFIHLVAKKERAELLNEIVVGFVDLYNIEAGIIEVEARTAKPLSDSQVKELTKVLEKSTGKTVELSTKEQPELKGGLLVKIDDTIIDGTIKHKLEQLEQTFLDKTVELN